MASATAPASASAAANVDLQENPHRWWILLGLILAAVMQVLDTTIVNVALPSMAGNLNATYQEISWVATGYILSNVVVLPMTAFLAARFGRKAYLSISIVVFTISSFFCGTSHSLPEMIFWRIIQGIGGAALLSTSQATLRQVFPMEQQGLVQSIFMLGIIVAPTVGPTLGGWITDNYTWSWCFFINVPIGIVSAALVWVFLHDHPGGHATTKPDWLGIGLLAVCLSCMQYVLEEGQQDYWFNDPWITRLAIVSGITLVWMLAWELSPRNTAPVVDFRVLKNRELSASIFLFVALGFGLYGGTFLYPLFTQTILGFSPTQTGITLLPGGIATGVSTMLCGRILNGKRPLMDARVAILIGIGFVLLSMWQLGQLTPQSGDEDTFVPLLVRGFGLGFLFVPINQAAFASMKPNEVQQGSGLVNLARQLGGSFGIAILATYVSNMAQFHRVMLLGNFTPGNPAFDQRQAGLTALMQHNGYSLSGARAAANHILDLLLTRQSLTLSYDDAFVMVLIVFAAVTPAILLLRPPKSQPTLSQESHAMAD